MSNEVFPAISYNDESSNELLESGVKLKIICLGDSAVGKSKLVERFLLDGYKAHTSSTYALQLYKHNTVVDGERVQVDIWDTAGQEMFQSMHPSYYHQAHACVLVFDATRKVTYRNLPTWYQELRQYRPNIPVFCAANKIDANEDATKKSFAFPQKHKLAMYYVSASDGTNVVSLFNDAIRGALKFKKGGQSLEDQIFEELDNL